MKNYKNIWYILSSIFFALVLFVYATSNNFQNNANIRLNKSETYTNTITNVPIDVKYDSDEYFISGVYNVMIKNNLLIKYFPTDLHISFGTPEEYEESKKYSFKEFI